MPVKAPPAAAAVAYSWTGIYVGAHGGPGPLSLSSALDIFRRRRHPARNDRASFAFQRHDRRSLWRDVSDQPVRRRLRGSLAPSTRRETGGPSTPTSAITYITETSRRYSYNRRPQRLDHPRDRWLLTAGEVDMRLRNGQGHAAGVCCGSAPNDLAAKRANGTTAGGGRLCRYSEYRSPASSIKAAYWAQPTFSIAARCRKVAGTCLGVGDNSTSDTSPYDHRHRVRLRSVKTDPR